MHQWIEVPVSFQISVFVFFRITRDLMPGSDGVSIFNFFFWGNSILKIYYLILPNIASSYISAHAEATSDYFFPTLLLDSLKGEKFLEHVG